MNAHLARLALALYPLAYRRRYGEEMTTLLEETPPSPAVIVDLLRGAARAHLRPEPAVAGEVGPDERLRLGVGSVLLCWVLFAVAGLALYKTTEGPAAEGGGTPGLLDGLHLAIQILAALGSVAVVLGAAPLVFVALRQGGGRPEVRRVARRAFGYVAVFVAATAALVVVAERDAPRRRRRADPRRVVAGRPRMWDRLRGVARRGLLAIVVPPRVVLLAGACATVVVAAMVGIVLLTPSTWSPWSPPPPVSRANRTGRSARSAWPSLAILLAAMLAVSASAALGIRRAWAR